MRRRPGSLPLPVRLTRAGCPPRASTHCLMVRWLVVVPDDFVVVARFRGFAVARGDAAVVRDFGFAFAAEPRDRVTALLVSFTVFRSTSFENLLRPPWYRKASLFLSNALKNSSRSIGSRVSSPLKPG